MEKQDVGVGEGFCSTLAGPAPFVFLLCSLPYGHGFSTGVRSRKGAGKGRNCLSLSIPLCPGVISSHLFSLINFFFAPFCCCCYFSFFLRVGIFSPQSFPGSSFPCDPPETGNHLGCKGLLVGHWSPAVASSSFQAVNPSQATRGILHTSPLLPHRSPWKNSQ